MFSKTSRTLYRFKDLASTRVQNKTGSITCFAFQHSNILSKIYKNARREYSWKRYSGDNMKNAGNIFGIIAGIGVSLLAPALLVAYWTDAEEDKKTVTISIGSPEMDSELRKHFQKSNETYHPVGEKKKSPIYRIVLTGGPCGGKSTSLSHISDRLRSLGFRVFIVPESATIVITGGGIWKDFGQMTPDQILAFEGSLMKTKMALEDSFYSIAEATGEPCVIICDRGTMDTSAYLPAKSWELLLDEYGWNVVNIRDRRYDAVIHLVTAAIGAEKFYTTENNSARRETPQEARALDFKILNAWVGHPTIRIVDNSTDFETKIKRVVTQVCQVVGAPKPVGVKRKFLVELSDDIPVNYEQFEVEQTYLVKGKAEGTTGFIFVRRRGQNGQNSYSYSVLRDVPGEEKRNCVLERQISGREYLALIKQSDPDRVPVKKQVKCFVYNNQYFTLNSFMDPIIPGLLILETESESLQQNVQLPDWLKAKKEVTSDEDFNSFQIAKHQGKKLN